MGNNDGMLEGLSDANKVVEFDGGYFSFAFGDEIALVLYGISGYYILNCTSKLWKEVNSIVESGVEKSQLVNWWVDKSKEYEASEWSGDFEVLADTYPKIIETEEVDNAG